MVRAALYRAASQPLAPPANFVGRSGYSLGASGTGQTSDVVRIVCQRPMFSPEDNDRPPRKRIPTGTAKSTSRAKVPPSMLKIAQHSRSENQAESQQHAAPAADAARANVRATLYVASDVLDEARNAAVYLAGYPAHLTLTRLVDNALRAELQRLRDQYHGGQPFPARSAELKGGRPIAA
jgi:hypothetical protein